MHLLIILQSTATILRFLKFLTMATWTAGPVLCWLGQFVPVETGGLETHALSPFYFVYKNWTARQALQLRHSYSLASLTPPHYTLPWPPCIQWGNSVYLRYTPPSTLEKLLVAPHTSQFFLHSLRSHTPQADRVASNQLTSDLTRLTRL